MNARCSLSGCDFAGSYGEFLKPDDEFYDASQSRQCRDHFTVFEWRFYLSLHYHTDNQRECEIVTYINVDSGQWENFFCGTLRG